MGVELLVGSAVFSEDHLLGIILVYIGPGAGLAALGSLLAVIGAGVLTTVGLLWYPVRQAFRKLRARRVKEFPAPKNDIGKQEKARGLGA